MDWRWNWTIYIFFRTRYYYKVHKNYYELSFINNSFFLKYKVITKIANAKYNIFFLSTLFKINS